ncbi:MAG: ABC transporter substrate-binding protein [Actinomycetaceae bacterium]
MTRKLLVTTRRMSALGVVATVALVFAGCDSDSEESESVQAGEDGLIPITIAETPGLPTNFVEFGIERGLWAAAGLDVTVTSIAGGSQQATAAMSGDADFIGGDVISFNTFINQGMPLRVVAPGTSASEDPGRDFAVVLVREDSPISGPEDLLSASLTTNELDNITSVSVVGALRSQGLDSSGLEFVEIPFPEMLSALESGHVDAATVIEPFATMGIQQGFRAVLRPFVGWHSGTQIGLALTTEQFANANPEVVDAFQEAHRAIAEYITLNPDEFREALGELGEFDPDVLAEMALPTYRQELDRDSIIRGAELMVDLGLLGDVPDIDAHIDEDA